MANIDYGKQRPRVLAPHISLSDLRSACGLTLDQVCVRFEQETGERLTRGALSAIENGVRGASAKTLAGLEAAYGLRPSAINTTYEPRGTAA